MLSLVEAFLGFSAESILMSDPKDSPEGMGEQPLNFVRERKLLYSFSNLFEN
jgi:hypothetical protein